MGKALEFDMSLLERLYSSSGYPDISCHDGGEDVAYPFSCHYLATKNPPDTIWIFKRYSKVFIDRVLQWSITIRIAAK